jgi:hypothetical protein
VTALFINFKDCTQIDRQTGRQTDRQTDRQEGREAGIQTFKMRVRKVLIEMN